jgi:hypothetical protein
MLVDNKTTDKLEFEAIDLSEIKGGLHSFATSNSVGCSGPNSGGCSGCAGANSGNCGKEDQPQKLH